MERLAQVMECLSSYQEAALVCYPANRVYLTGFHSSAGILLITKEQSYFIVDARYIEAARKQLRQCTVVLEENLVQQLPQLLNKHGIQRVLVEASHMSIHQGEHYKEILTPAQLVTSERLDCILNNMRQIKDSQELAWLQQAQQITDQAFTYILNYIKPGVSELDMMMLFGEYTARLGCEKRSFNMIFTSGTKTSLPHGGGELRSITAGDFVMMDVGCMVNGYSSDMTRTVAVGTVSDKQRCVYETVLAAQLAALAVIGPGVRCSDVHNTAVDVIESSPFKGTFGHGLGHSLGLEIHENPRFNGVCHDLTRPGMVITVEPGCYLPGEFGVRIEDMVVITQDGYRNMTASPKELIIL